MYEDDIIWAFRLIIQGRKRVLLLATVYTPDDGVTPTRHVLRQHVM